MKKIALIVSLLVITSVAFSGCSLIQKETQPAQVEEAGFMEDRADELVKDTSDSAGMESESEMSYESEQEAAEYLLIATQDGTTALDLLKEAAEVEYDEFDFGVFIKAIDGKAGNDEYYWAFYVNDEFAQQGADKTELKAGDSVRFVYEEVGGFDEK